MNALSVAWLSMIGLFLVLYCTVQVKVHYDGWPDDFDIWSDDSSPLLQPVGWAARTGHPLQVTRKYRDLQTHNRPTDGP